MVEGGMACVRHLLFGFNFVFFLIGLVLIIAGGVVQGYFRDYFEVIGNEFSSVAILLVVVGVFVFAIGFFGCCGAWKKNICMMNTFAGLLLIIFVLEIAAGIAGFVLKDRVEGVVRDGLEDSLNKYDNTTGTKESWDEIQKDLKCCGVDGYKDWAGKLGIQLYPKSCCEDPKTVGCGLLPNLAYPDGCLKSMTEFLKHNLIWIGIIGIIVALIQLFGITFACCLSRAIRNEYEVV